MTFADFFDDKQILINYNLDFGAFQSALNLSIKCPILFLI